MYNSSRSYHQRYAQVVELHVVDEELQVLDQVLPMVL